jgi:hypothetical protein
VPQGAQRWQHMPPSEALLIRGADVLRLGPKLVLSESPRVATLSAYLRAVESHNSECESHYDKETILKCKSLR